MHFYKILKVSVLSWPLSNNTICLLSNWGVTMCCITILRQRGSFDLIDKRFVCWLITFFLRLFVTQGIPRPCLPWCKSGPNKVVFPFTFICYAALHNLSGCPLYLLRQNVSTSPLMHLWRGGDEWLGAVGCRTWVASSCRFDGLEMVLWSFIELLQFILIFSPHGRTDKGVPRGPRGL